ncbi:MAG: hypothetical protein N0E48_22220, partial [Candidatus Thiodiazotropha endolucinida]|nr:hypothetical protein [Candidatus Thiodiazotropha taylori]MCW4346051.1 hypothetical protein [Candidatus Thiodiazotropha endolucinida]
REAVLILPNIFLQVYLLLYSFFFFFSLFFSCYTYASFYALLNWDQAFWDGCTGVLLWLLWLLHILCGCDSG